jgi:23S rRNA-/tRNA-specific pseudouridylate synthase
MLKKSELNVSPSATESSAANKTVVSASVEAAETDDLLICRQALHAFRLTIRHPLTGNEMQFEAPLPEDFQRTLTALETL